MLWLIPLLPLLAGPLLWLSGRSASRGLLGAISLLVVLATLALLLAAMLGGWQGSYRWSSWLAPSVALSTAGLVFGVTLTLVAGPILLFAAWHESAPDGHGRPPVGLVATLVTFVGAMQLLLLADDLLTLLVAWELVGALSWGLIGQDWRRIGHQRDAGWAFLLTRFGDLGLYLAAGAAFVGSGSFAFADLDQLQGPVLTLFAAGALLAAAAKSGQLPFSFWLFSAMSGPTAVSALLHAATMVAAGVYLLVRLHPVFAPLPWFAPVVVAIGLSTALAGGTVACLQGHAKKLLAASTSAHYGLMLTAVGAGFPGVALLHFVVHAFMKGTLFLAVGIAEHHTGGYSLGAMRLGRLLPGIALAALIGTLALAGVPPLGGGWSKEKITAAASELAPWLAVMAVLAGGLSALYAARLQVLAYGRRETPALQREGPGHHAAESAALYALAATSALLSLLWWPGARRWLEGWLGLAIPPGKTWELVLSLVLIGLGIALGWWAARRGWGNEDEENRRWPTLTNWLGIPATAKALVRAVHAGCGGLARFDDLVVDGAVRAVAEIWQALAGGLSRRGEGLFDGAVGAAARITRRTGKRVRALQSGMSHQYYAVIALGFALFLIVLGLGALL